MAAEPHKRHFGIDPRSGKLALGTWRIPMPRSRAGRIGLGSALMVGGTLGFLPVLGFWMLPLGLVVLSNDISFIRRRRRRMVIWWSRRKQGRNAEPDPNKSKHRPDNS
jgi:hypothetical protein